MSRPRAACVATIVAVLVAEAAPTLGADGPTVAPRALAQALVDGLSSPDLATRVATAEALGRRRGAARGALPALFDLVAADDGASDAALHAIAAIVPLGGGAWTDDVATIVVPRAAAGVLGARLVVAKVIGATFDDLSALVRSWSGGLGATPDPWIAETVVDVLTTLADLGPATRGADARSPRVVVDDARRALQACLDAPDRRLAVRAACALLRDPARTSAALAVLERALDDPVVDVRALALTQLGLGRRLGEAVAARLPTLLADPAPALRAAAARLLGERGPYGVPDVPALGALARDAAPEVRVAAVAALDRIGLNAPDVPTRLAAFADDRDVGVLAELHRVVATRGGATGRYAEVAARLAARDGVPHPTSGPSDDARTLAALAAISAASHVDAVRLEALAGDTTPAVRDAAFARLDALAASVPAGHVPALVARIEDPDAADVPPWAPRLLARAGAAGVDALLTIVGSTGDEGRIRACVDGLRFASEAQLERVDVRRLLLPTYLEGVGVEADAEVDAAEREARARFEAVLDRHLEDVRDAARGPADDLAAGNARWLLARRGAEGLRLLVGVFAERIDTGEGGERCAEGVPLEARHAAIGPFLAEADPRVRAAACRLLVPGRTDAGLVPVPAPVAAALEHALTDDDGRVRAAAAWTLGWQPLSEEALARCVAMLVDRHPAAREAASGALSEATARLGPFVDRVLAQLDASPDEEARAAQLWLLAYVPGEAPPRLVAAWVAAARAPSAWLARAGLDALAIRRPTDSAVLESVLDTLVARAGDAAHTASAARTLGRYGPAAGRAVPLLERLAAAGSKEAAEALPAARGDVDAWIALLSADVRSFTSRAALRDLRALGARATAALPALRAALAKRRPVDVDDRADLEAAIDALERASAK